MNHDKGIARILDSTTQAAPQMTEALADYGNGRMGDGILNLIEWVRQDSKAIWLARGRFQGAAVAGTISALSFATVSLFMHRQLKKEQQKNEREVCDLLNEVLECRAQRDLAEAKAEIPNPSDTGIAAEVSAPEEDDKKTVMVK